MLTLFEKRNALIAQFQLKHADLTKILDKGAEITQEDVLGAETLKGQLATLQASIEETKKVDDLALSLSGYTQYLNAPANALPNTGVETPGVLGMKAAGSSQIIKEHGESVLYQEGEGLLTDKQIKAITNPDYAKAFKSYLRTKGNYGLMNSSDVKLLQEGTDTAGGYLVPEQMLARIIQKKPTPIRVAENVQKFTTGRDALVLPKVNYATDDLYTTGIRTTWTGEVPATATTARVTDPLFGEVRIEVYTAMLSMPLTNNLIEDSVFPLQSWSADKFAETIGLLYDNMAINGTGVGQPTGLLANPGGAGQPAVVNCGNPITADLLVNLAYQVPEQYEPDIKWIMNKTNMASYIGSLKDTQGRYLWGMGYQDSGLMSGGNGMPNVGQRSLLGYPVLLQGFMPNRGANAFPLILGDLQGYYLVNRVGFSIQVLNELYAETNQVLLLGRIRFGGQTCEDWRIKIGKQA